MGIGKGDLACMVSMHEVNSSLLAPTQRGASLYSTELAKTHPRYGSKLSFSDTFKKAARQTSFIKAVPNGAVKRCA
ncbi:unnamed protein product, partial [Vitis vinifera]